MKTLLICHDGATLDQFAIPRWLSSFSELVGIIVLQERSDRKWRRIRREIKRVGVRFIDVLAFRLYYQIVLAKTDQLWEESLLRDISRKYPRETSAPVLYSHSPNTREVEQFIKERQPDMILERCKTLLTE